MEWSRSLVSLGPGMCAQQAIKSLPLKQQGRGLFFSKATALHCLCPRRHRTVAVIGPNSDVTVTMIGNYAGIACGYTTPVQGIGRYTRAIHRAGCPNVKCKNAHLFGDAIAAAGQADATVLVMGLDQSIEAEFKDRDGLLLPGYQQELISKVAAASKGPTILVLMSGGPVDVSFAEHDPRVSGILWVGYPGQAGGTAIADVLFGTHNPGGKLPMSWYTQDYLSKVPMTRMDMRSDEATGFPGRSYRFYKGPLVYPFGHGFSYSNFIHTLAAAPAIFTVPVDGRHKNTTDAVRVTHAKCGGLSLGLQVDVKNVGSKDGSHTLLVYSTPPVGHWGPRKQLVAFAKVHVPARTQLRVPINIHVCKFLSVVDRSGVRRIPMGQHNLHIADLKHLLSIQSTPLGVIKS